MGSSVLQRSKQEFMKVVALCTTDGNVCDLKHLRKEAGGIYWIYTGYFILVQPLSVLYFTFVFYINF